jgi:hypothetical protein
MAGISLTALVIYIMVDRKKRTSKSAA